MLIIQPYSRHNLHLPVWTQTLPHVKDVACKVRNQLCITAAQHDLTQSWKDVPQSTKYVVVHCFLANAIFRSPLTATSY